LIHWIIFSETSGGDVGVQVITTIRSKTSGGDEGVQVIAIITA
jgi:hypothetical protein